MGLPSLDVQRTEIRSDLSAEQPDQPGEQMNPMGRSGRSPALNSRRLFSRMLIATVFSLGFVACGGGHDEMPYGTWSASPDNLDFDLSYFGIPPVPPGTITNQTLRYVAHISQGGNALRIRFSNYHGTTPVLFERVRVA